MAIARADAGPARPTSSRRGAGGAARVRRAARAPAPLRTRPQHPKRDRPGADAPGQPAVRPPRRARRGPTSSRSRLRISSRAPCSPTRPPTPAEQEHRMPRPIILGVVGDSAAGKTTITRGLVRALGEDAVTHVCTDDYHRYDRAQRAELGITPLHPDCNYIDIMEQHLTLLRRGEAILKPVYSHADGTFGPPGYVRPQRFTVVEGLLGYHTAAMRDVCDVRVYLAPPEDAAPALEGQPRLLAARLHDRPGARRARPARGRLGRLHPPPGALRRSRHRPSPRPTAATTRPPRRPADPARRPGPPRSRAVHRRRRGHHADRAGRRAAGAHPRPARRRPRRRDRAGDLGEDALREPSALAAPGRVHGRAPICTARSRSRSSSS